jgi:uncharacterized protein YecE (DUF72 family)
VGVFYPLTRVDELQFYSRYFNVVEVNSTFYRPAVAKTAESWVRRTPDQFEFAVKAWRQFTHEPEWTVEEIKEFREGLLPLLESGKFGCWLFQFPSSFHHSSANEDRLRSLLDRFRDEPRCVELRHSSWNDSPALLAQCGAGPVIIDEPKFSGSIRQQLQAAEGIIYLRFHGRKGEKWWRHEHRNDRYDYLYTAAQLEPYAVQLKEIVESQPVRKAYVLFNNHPGAQAVANAVMMRSQLGDPQGAPLPSSMLERFPELVNAL